LHGLLWLVFPIADPRFLYDERAVCKRLRWGLRRLGGMLRLPVAAFAGRRPCPITWNGTRGMSVRL